MYICILIANQLNHYHPECLCINISNSDTFLIANTNKISSHIIAISRTQVNGLQLNIYICIGAKALSVLLVHPHSEQVFCVCLCAGAKPYSNRVPHQNVIFGGSVGKLPRSSHVHTNTRIQA